MDKNIIKKHLIENFLSEDKKPGTLSSTEEIQSDSKKINSDNQKEVAKKMKSYEKPIKAETEPVKRELSEKEKDVHSDEELFPGSMAALDYDSRIDKKFADRFEKSLAGHETTGNSNKYANVVQDKVWGGDPNFGETLVYQTKKMADKKKAVWAGMGDTMLPYGVRNGNYALSKNKKIKEGMKRLVFKKEFKGVENALRLIPESYKVNNKQFQMTDGNEKYEIRWEGNLTEGRAVILKASDKQLMNEDMQKMKHLMGYKSQETLGNLKGAERINEDKTFNKIWNKTKNLLNENYHALKYEDVMSAFNEICSEALEESKNGYGVYVEVKLNGGSDYDSLVFKTSDWYDSSATIAYYANGYEKFKERFESPEDILEFAKENLDNLNEIDFSNTAAGKKFDDYNDDYYEAEKTWKGNRLAKLKAKAIAMANEINNLIPKAIDDLGYEITIKLNGEQVEMYPIEYDDNQMIIKYKINSFIDRSDEYNLNNYDEYGDKAEYYSGNNLMYQLSNIKRQYLKAIGNIQSKTNYYPFYIVDMDTKSVISGFQSKEDAQYELNDYKLDYPNAKIYGINAIKSLGLKPINVGG